ncbi:hypothetical protein [Bacillus sp. T33-2]|uniref:hypothetical protein n=1 Tax=Bacillus sp. T33-2 TaxID=2054168 RepID=UPI000C78D587|nr:hypothetical protein [Bacillus sp. T33-2]PLR99607.1 hypothetical protein CVD19_00660 [Bacillus sp. T33-2]
MFVTKYSQVDSLFKDREKADQAMHCFVKSGFVRMPDYAKVEVRKFMEALNSLELTYTVKHTYKTDSSKYSFGVYEFMAEGFIDDRK